METMLAATLSICASCWLLALFFARKARFWLLLNVLAAAASVTVAVLIYTGPVDVWTYAGTLRLGGEPISLRLDALSAFFVALLGILGGTGALYSIEYWNDSEQGKAAASGRFWWSALLFSILLVLIAANGLHFIVAWELFALSAYFLIILNRQSEEARAAGWLYLGASHLATLCLFAFFALLAVRSGSWELVPMRDHPGLAPLFWLALAGFGLKAGLFPLHVWLPAAHGNAPSHVSAILSGLTLKIGVYGLMRFSGWMPVPSSAAGLITLLGLVSAVLGVVFALGQHDLKRLLAYHSVENIGIILIGLGCALVARETGNTAWGQLALAGSLLHVFNHGLFKSLLFLAAGSVHHATGTRQMSRLGGLWRTMPWTSALFALGAVAICGLPPLNGFISEWLIYLGLFNGLRGPGPLAWIAILGVALLALTGALALVCFVKVCGVVFLGEPRSKEAEQAHESGPAMRWAMGLLAAGCIGIGLAPALFWPVLQKASTAWNADWHSMTTPPPILTVGMAHMGLVFFTLLAVWVLKRRIQHNGLVRAPTWDCGYAHPTARMQYTVGSFASLVTGWFRWILCPKIHEDLSADILPTHGCSERHTPETVLAYVVEPVSRAVLKLSGIFRLSQHGRVQLYLVYFLLATVVIAGVVTLGGKQ